MTHPVFKGTLIAVLLAWASKPSAPAWQSPKPGWLYVLDLEKGTAPEKSHILVVDPEKESVVEELPGAGYQTVLARSSDGKRVYVLAGSDLSVVDSSSGRITSQASVPKRIMFTAQPNIPSMAVSGDDKTIVLEEHGTFFNESSDQAFLESIDVSGESATPTGHRVEATNCGVASLTAEKGSAKVFVHCIGTNSFLSLSVGSAGALSLASEVLLPSATYQRAQDISTAPPGSYKSRASVACVNAEGNLRVLIREGEAAPSAPSDSILQIDPSLAGSARRHIPFQACLATPSGQLYVRSKALANYSEGEADQIEVFDLLAGKQVASIRMPAKVSNMALSGGASTLYLVSPEARAVFLVDTKSNEIKKTVAGIGKHPVLVMPAQ